MFKHELGDDSLGLGKESSLYILSGVSKRVASQGNKP